MSIRTDYTDGNYEYEISNPKIASKIFQSYLKKNNFIEENRTKKNTLVNYKDLYEQLPRVKQRAVNNIIRNLVSTDLLEQNFGLYFSELLKQADMTTYFLANMLFEKYSCDEVLGMKSNKESLGIDDLCSKLESFKKIAKPQDKSAVLIMDICNILSVDMDVLCLGIGNRFNIDEERIMDILQQRDINAEQFYSQTVNEYLNDCNKCNKSGVCEWQEKVIYFKQMDKQTLGEFIADKLKVDVEEIVISETVYMEPDNFLLDKYFSKLKVKEQKAIQQLICDLHVSEISKD